MKAKDLARKLLENPEMEVMILDGFNGGGYPRDINLGPTLQVVTEKDANESADCEDLIGENVIILGYGFY